MSTRNRACTVLSRVAAVLAIAVTSSCRTERPSPETVGALPFAPIGSSGPPVRYSERVTREVRDAGALIPLSLRERTVGGESEVPYRASMDLADQVLSIDVDSNTDTEPLERLAPNFDRTDPEFVSAAALSWKAKQFEDGLFAAVEAAADQGIGAFPSRKKLLEDISRSLMAIGGSKAARTFVDAALRLSTSSELGLETTARLSSQLRFDPASAIPLGFYSWSESLAQTYRRNRWLQTVLTESVASELANVMTKDDAMGAAYAASLELLERMTNPFRVSDLRPFLRAIRAGESARGAEECAFWPEPRSLERSLAANWIAARPVEADGPMGPSMTDELIRRIESGIVSLRPRPDSGWYDRQLFALEPLIVPSTMPESTRIVMSETYRESLRALFRASNAATRETHIASLGWANSVALRFYPQLSIEPLPTYYQRRADSYRFIRSVLEKAFGLPGLAKIHRMTISGSVGIPLSQELRLLESLFRGASVVAREELGIPHEIRPHDAELPVFGVASSRVSAALMPRAGAGDGAAAAFGSRIGSAVLVPNAGGAVLRRDAGASANDGGDLGHADAAMAIQDSRPSLGDPSVSSVFGSESAVGVARFRRWAQAISDDPDLNRDVRMMVPVGYDGVRRQYRVWVVLGVRRRALTVCFRTPPSIQAMVTADGRPVDQSQFEIRFECEPHGTDEVVSVETTTPRLMTREQFARHCDHHQSVDAILANL